MIEIHRWDLVVFDWDGTIMDTTALITKSIQHAAREMGLRVPDDSLASSVIGLDWRRALAKAVPDLPLERAQEFAEIYKTFYLPNEERVWLFDGMSSLVRDLQSAGIMTAVATGKSRRGLDRVLTLTGLGDAFTTTKTADETAPKPHPDMLEEIAVETGADPSRTVMIGDTTHDLFMAKAYGCDAIGMTWGAMPAEELLKASPLALCSTAQQLRAVLERP